MIEHPSSIREIMSLVAEFEKHPEKWPRRLIYLAGGWPQDSPPDLLRDLIKDILENEELWRKSARYSPTIGYPDMREAISKYEKYIWNRNVDPANIIVGLGSTEQIGAVFLSILNPNDEVIFTSPGYLNYKRQLDLEMKHSVEVKYWRIINEDGEFKPDFDELQNKISEKTKLIIITTPGNPDGQVWSDEQISTLLDIAEEKEVFILFDLAYRAFIFDERNIPSYISKSPGEWDIWSCTLSKELRAPGWRASYLLVPDELIRAIDTIEQARTLAPTSLIQIILTNLFSKDILLGKLKEFYVKGAKRYAEMAKYTIKLLRSIEGIRVLEPRGGFYVFFDISSYDKSSKRVWRELIEKYQVALAPGVDFNGFEGWLRLSFAPVIETPDVLEEGLNRIKEYFMSKK